MKCKALAVCLACGLAACATIRPDQEPALQSFFPQDASVYMAMRPKRFSEALKASSPALGPAAKPLTQLFNASKSAWIYRRSDSLHALFLGSFPKYFIDRALQRSPEWRRLEGFDGFKHASINLEVGIPVKNRLYAAQSDLEQTILGAHPPIGQTLPDYVIDAFSSYDMAVYLPQAQNFLASLAGGFPLPAFQGLALVNRHGSVYQIEARLVTASPLAARGLAAVLRTFWPQLAGAASAWPETFAQTEISAEGPVVILKSSSPPEEMHALLARYIFRGASAAVQGLP